MTTPHVTSREIAELIAWMTRLTQAGPDHADPTELATFHTAKTALLTRLTGHPHPISRPTPPPCENTDD